MAAAISINASEARVLAVVGGTTSGVNVPEARVFAAANIPAPGINSSEARVFAVGRQPAMIDIPQARVLAVVRGKIADPTVRVWEFTLDSHDYYVIHLGDTETLIYDTKSKQWYNWGSDAFKHWRANVGCNWLDGAKVAADYGSPIVVGDDTYGVLYFLNSDADTDDDPVSGSAVPHTFERITQGQTVVKGYAGQQCFGIEVLGSIGDLSVSTLTGVTLEYSDDRGNSYVNAGTIDVTAGDYNARLHWRSLGQMRAPGRLFRLTDYGALRRVDSMDMNDGQ